MQPYTLVGKKEMTWWPWQRQFDPAKGCLDSPLCGPQLSPLLYYVVNGLSPSSLWMAFPDAHLGVFECSTYISGQKLSRMLSWKSCWLRGEDQTLALQAPFFLNAHCSSEASLMAWILCSRRDSLAYVFKQDNKFFVSLCSVFHAQMHDSKTYVDMSMAFHLPEPHFPYAKCGIQVRDFIL